MTLLSKDTLATCVQLAVRLVEKYPKLADRPRERFISFIGELIKVSVQDVDLICLPLLRYIPSGDVSQKTLWLVNSLLNLFNKTWIYPLKKLLCQAVYTFLSLIPIHLKFQPTQALGQKEVKFCAEAIKERYTDLISIGRDFIRVFFDVMLIPEFEELWKANHSKSMETLMQPTNRLVLLFRISPDIEKNLLFLMTDVKVGTQRRYQTWFTQKYLATAETDPLILDLIRFVIIGFHPSNQLLASGMVPRWMILGWLLKSFKNPAYIGPALLQLLYDYFFFNVKTESIMNLEPAILLAAHSLPRYADVTTWIFECLMNSMTTQNWILPKEVLIDNVQKAIKSVVTKGVVGSLQFVTECKDINPQVKENIKHYFPNEVEPKKKIPTDKIPPKEMPKPQSPEKPMHSPIQQKSQPQSPQSPPQSPPSSPIKKDKPVVSDLSIFEPHLTELGKNAANKDKAIASLGHILDILEKENLGPHLSRIGEYFARIFSFEYGQKNSHLHIENIFYEKTPLKLFFERFFKSLGNDEVKKSYWTVLSAMMKYEPSLPYRVFLYCITRGSLLHECFDLLPKLPEIHKASGGFDLYEFILKERSNQSLNEKDIFLNDIKVLLEENPNCLVIVLPILTKYLSRLISGNHQFIFQVLFYFHPIVMEKLFFLASTGRIKMIGSENFGTLIEVSSEWEHYENNALWNLIVSDIKTDPKFDYVSFLKFLVEKIKQPSSNLMQLYSKVEPNYQMIKMLMTQETMFASSLVSVWIKTYTSSMKHLEGFCKEVMTMDEIMVEISLKNFTNVINSCRNMVESFGFLRELVHMKDKGHSKLVQVILDEIEVKKRGRDEGEDEGSNIKKRKMEEE